MPPKRAQEKKEEEVVDESTLPSWRTFILKVLFHDFITEELQQEFLTTLTVSTV
jgi:hypothetical protein